MYGRSIRVSLAISFVAIWLLPTTGVCADEVQPGGKVVTGIITPVKGGKEEKGRIPAGIELTVAHVNGRWFYINYSKDGAKLNGWVLDTNLIIAPASSMAKLTVGFLDEQARPESKLKKINQEFRRLDTNADGEATLNEFLASTKKPTLDELNSQYRKVLAKHGDPRPGTMAYAIRDAEFMRCFAEFRGWRDDWVVEMARLHGDPQSLGSDFLRTGDVRRSRLAQQLIDREDPTVRSRTAQALFKWADKNNDGKMTSKEFQQAVGL